MESTIEKLPEINKKEILIWESIGAFIIIVLGSVFHFIFEWLGEKAWIGWFFAVNESVWEHLKLGFWPALIFYGVEFVFLRKKVNNYILAKTIALFFNPIAIVMIYYSYTGALGIENFIIDILLFVVVVILQQLISYLLITRENFSEKRLLKVNIVSLVAVVIFLTLIVIFTYLPPKIPLFEDGLNPGNYGIF